MLGDEPAALGFAIGKELDAPDEGVCDGIEDDMSSPKRSMSGLAFLMEAGGGPGCIGAEAIR